MKKTFWGDYNKQNYPSLEKDISAKYVIIGGGIAGLSVAYFLLEQGKTDIVILEKNTVGSGSTGHSAGMLVHEPEQATWQKLYRTYGKKTVSCYHKEELRIIRTIKKIIQENGIDCDYEEQKLLFIASDKTSKKHVLNDFVARKKIKSKTTLLSAKKLSKKLVTQNFTLGEEISENISVNPLLFTCGFAKHLHSRGVRIYENSEVIDLSLKTLKTRNAVVTFEALIECRGCHDSKKHIDTYLTTILITNKLSKKDLINTGFIHREMFIDDEKRSFHYGKMTKDGRLMIGYGDVLKKNISDEDPLHIPHRDSILRFLKKVFPHSDIKEHISWSARYALTKSDHPYVRINKNHAVINGAGTQVDSMLSASYVVSKLFKQKHCLDSLFK